MQHFTDTSIVCISLLDHKYQQLTVILPVWFSPPRWRRDSGLDCGLEDPGSNPGIPGLCPAKTRLRDTYIIFL